jgi:hypothetical protein
LQTHSSTSCPARNQLTHCKHPAHAQPHPTRRRHPHPGPRRLRQARTGPAAYLPGLSARPCWPRCFPAPLTVGGQRGSRPAGLSEPVLLPLLLPLLGLPPLLPEPGASSPPCYRIIPAEPSEFPPLHRGAAAAASSSLCGPPPPSLNTFPPTPHPPRVSVTPFSSPPARSDALMPRMLQPPLCPSRGCGTPGSGRRTAQAQAQPRLPSRARRAGSAGICSPRPRRARREERGWGSEEPPRRHRERRRPSPAGGRV